MNEGQAKVFKNDTPISPTDPQNIEVPANLTAEIKTADSLEIRVRKIYQLNRKKRIGKAKSSRIL